MSHLAFLAAVLLAQADASPALTPPIKPIDLVSALETAVADAIARAEPAVVAITRVKSGNSEKTTAVRGKNPIHPAEPPGGFPGMIELGGENYFALPGDYGSGVVVGDLGQILTMYHLVQGASKIRVRAADRKEFDAEVIAADPRSDLAVIAPRVTPGSAAPKLTPIPIGDASKLRKGSFLTVLGNPYNAAKDGKASAGLGILANVARRMDVPYDERMLRSPMQALRHQPSLLQLDAKLNLGMSGGAVINMKGELVGITTTGGSPDVYDAQAGYAVPMDLLGRRVVEALVAGREVEYGFLGVTIDPTAGNRVRDVRPGTPAADAELLSGDTIIAVGGDPLSEEDGLSLALSAVPPGQPVALTVQRGDRQIEKTVTMAKYPVQGPVIATTLPALWRGVRVDFTSILAGATFADDIARAYSHGGVGVIGVETGSSADAAGLKRGMVITEVNGNPVKTPAEFTKAVEGGKGPVTLTTELGDEPDKKIVVK
ncbi:MAG: trypsin-like peptidase domain-containing protein [Isosphaeraceae bacterium]